MRVNRRSASAERARALDLWEAPAGAGKPLICLATTFTFDATFFETECLGRFLQMDSHPQESESVGYLIEREEKLASTRVSVLVDRRHATSKESMRWDVLPISVRGGIQHAKVAVLCWADHVRLIVGSGNLTEPGYRKNLEVFGALDISGKEGGPVAPFLASLEFLKAMLARAVGEEGRGPRQRAEEMVASVRKRVARWQPIDPGGRVVPVFTGLGRSVFDQIQDAWPNGGPPRYARVLSPFYDRNGHWVDVIGGLTSIMAKRGERDVSFYVPAETLPEGKTRLRAPREIVDAASERAEVFVHEVPLEQDKESRPLHAKMLTLANENWKLILIGSSNFTRAGLGVSKGNHQPVNFEANLAYLFRNGEPELRKLQDVWPDYAEDEVDLASRKLVWEPTDELDGEEASGIPLPAGFQEALFAPVKSPQLIILLEEKLPERWKIHDQDQGFVLSSETWNHKSGRHELSWVGRTAPLVLTVTWRSAGKADSYTASWPVNVLDLATLPPPDKLASLSLEELIRVLSSTRPLHVAVVQALQRRLRQRSNEDVQLDPHRRVNTETFLLRRTKRVALALERLRERLEKPVLTSEAFEWRLRGPVGPLALANAFHKEARNVSETAFFLAELALTLKRVRAARPAEGELKMAAIQASLVACMAEIRALLPALQSNHSPINRYVKRVFAEEND